MLESSIYLDNLDYEFLKPSKVSEVSKTTDKLQSQQPHVPKCSVTNSPAAAPGLDAVLAISSLILTDPYKGALCLCVPRPEAGLEERAEVREGQ